MINQIGGEGAREGSGGKMERREGRGEGGESERKGRREGVLKRKKNGGEGYDG